MSTGTTPFIFFGTDEHAGTILDELKSAGLVPSLIVTAPDRPKGRGLQMTPPPVKLWAQKNDTPVLQSEKLDTAFAGQLSQVNGQLFVVARYGKIIPKEILTMPKHGALNVHPSLLPFFRGPSPAQSQILEAVSETGVTIILLDEKVDHGPILAQEVVPMPEPLPRAYELEDMLAHLGGKLLAETIPQWIAGEIDPQEQDHGNATFTKKIKKEDGLIDRAGNPELNLRKIRAYDPWPGTYFFKDSTRVKIIDATLEDRKLKITRVIPEGKKEMDYETFLRN
ncbi:MAG TPA: methionyl-tRNA formyltransferase [Candidatus Paceibacterota bacterium]